MQKKHKLFVVFSAGLIPQHGRFPLGFPGKWQKNNFPMAFLTRACLLTDSLEGSKGTPPNSQTGKKQTHPPRLSPESVSSLFPKKHPPSVAVDCLMRRLLQTMNSWKNQPGRRGLYRPSVTP